jgi:hypothetical protein
MVKKQPPPVAPAENVVSGKTPAKKPVVIKAPSKTVLRAKR